MTGRWRRGGRTSLLLSEITRMKCKAISAETFEAGDSGRGRWVMASTIQSSFPHDHLSAIDDLLANERRH